MRKWIAYLCSSPNAAVGRVYMHPKELSILDFTYSLPEEKIAAYPLSNRDESRLLVYQNGTIREDQYKNIAAYIPEDSLLVFNNTRVVEARLLFQKSTGAQIEIFCLEPDDQYPDISTALQQQGSVLWKCLIGGASKWKPGQVLEKKISHADQTILLEALYKEKLSDGFLIEFCWQPASLCFAGLLHAAGLIPLPPYIKRKAELSDSERYQTVYAQQEGSVAAPTAGLHFTKSVFDSLREKNISTAYLTLHVGAGTFKPVKSETMAGHDMHAEFIQINKAFLSQLLRFTGKPIIATGTTSLRTIESLYWLGVKTILDKEISHAALQLTQWDSYELPQLYSVEESLHALLNWLTAHSLEELITKTQIIIAPGYKARIATGLITNFHQPQSTLLLLVAALVGDNWRRIYDYALKHGFRFLSYGDGSLLWFNGSL